MAPDRPSRDLKPAATQSDDGKRFDKRIRRRLMVKFGTGKADKTGFSKNVSTTGLFIQTNTLFRPGTTIQVVVHFPDRTFSQWATVVWGKQAPPELAHVIECGMGVRIVDPGEDWTAYVQEWKKKMGA